MASKKLTWRQEFRKATEDMNVMLRNLGYVGISSRDVRNYNFDTIRNHLDAVKDEIGYRGWAVQEIERYQRHLRLAQLKYQDEAEVGHRAS